jgi:hypothetical protein
MLRTVFVLPDGTEIASGLSTVQTSKSSIRSCTITKTVNSGTELTLGSVCASLLEATLQVGSDFVISTGQEITVYKETDNGTRHKIGIFILEKPSRPSVNICKITAYDRIIKLDKDLSSWISALDEWSYTMEEFVPMVCQQCGLELDEDWNNLPSGPYHIEKFSANVTGRQLIQWVGEANARFFHVTPDGKGKFDWYKDSGASITPSGEHYILQGSLSYEDYETVPVEAVGFQENEEDVTVWHPEAVESNNVLTIKGNKLIGMGPKGLLINIYREISEIKYTPCKVSIPANFDINAGDIVTVTDRNGKTFKMFVFSKTQSGQRDTLECTGSSVRGSTEDVNSNKQQTELANTNQSVGRLEAKVSKMSGELSDTSETAKSNKEKVDKIANQLLLWEENLGKVYASCQLLDGGKLETTINESQWKAIYQNSDGVQKSSLSFDFDKKQFVYTGQVGGENYADSYIAIDGNELQVFDAKGLPTVKIGQNRTNANVQLPYIKLLSRLTGGSELDSAGIVLRTQKGIWIGNEKLNFAATSGAGISDIGVALTSNSAGIFINTANGKITLYSGTHGSDIYTGEAIAKFG